MPSLVLGPILRFADQTTATVWVETDRPCEVSVLGTRTPTFSVAGHHYAIAVVADLQPGRSYAYSVALDGEVCWPDQSDGLPPSTIRTLMTGQRLRLLAASCRVTAPHDGPWSLPRRKHRLGKGPDALHAFAVTMAAQPPEQWPDALILLGDQVYADDPSPEVLRRLHHRRHLHRPKAAEVASFEEYTWLYQEAWRSPVIRWLLANVPTAMICDDHDVIDDWNISAAWLERIRRQPWWEAHVVGGLMAYWLYQHLGNLAPADLEANELLRCLRGVDDGEAVLREWAVGIDAGTAGAGGERLSYHRDFGTTRLVVVDARNGRVLTPGARQMVDEAEWSWLDGRLRGGVDHLLVASSVPVLLPRAVNDLERWSEAVCDGAWGRWPAQAAEWLRQAIDLEHWAAFGRSLHQLVTVVGEVAGGRRGDPPGSVLLLSGDVHYSYVAQAAFGSNVAADSAVFQVVTSPARNAVPSIERVVHRFSTTPLAAVLARALLGNTGAGRRPIDWRLVRGPWFGNNVGVIELDGRHATIELHQPCPRPSGATGTQVSQRVGLC